MARRECKQGFAGLNALRSGNRLEHAHIARQRDVAALNRLVLRLGLLLWAEALPRRTVDRQHAVGDPLRRSFDDDGVAGVQVTQVIKGRALAHAVSGHRKVARLTGHLRVGVAPRSAQQIILVGAFEDREGEVRAEGRDIEACKCLTELRGMASAARIVPLLLQRLIGFVL